MKKYVFDDIDSEEYRNEQLANGRYYYLKTKMVSLSNIEHARVNDMYQKVYDDKFFRREDIHERWRDLQATTYDVLEGYKQNDQREKVINKKGVLVFDRAFIGGNNFVCLECVDAGFVEDEEIIEGEIPINQDMDSIFKKIKADPWSDRPRLDANRLYDLQANHNESLLKTRFSILKYIWWDDIDYLGKIDWEGKQVYGFRVIDKTSVFDMYFDIEKIKYAGQERAAKTYLGDGLGYRISIQKTIVLDEKYSDSNFGVNSDGLSRESEGAINQKLDRECKFDTDCLGIIGYSIKPGTCPAYMERCVENQCALMCADPRQVKNGGCTKFDKETQSFITYACLENESGISRLVKEENSENGICKVSNSEEKTIIFYECIDDKEGKIELLREIN